MIVLATLLIPAIGIPAIGAAADAPSNFVPARSARPLGGIETEPRVTARWADVQQRQVGPALNNWRLRYRGGADVRITDSPSDRDTPVRRVDYQRPRASVTDAPVQFVSQIAPLDPFDDPFGDRSQPTTPPLLPEPREIEEPRIRTSAQPGAAPLPENPLPDSESAPLPPLERTPNRAPSDCDRVYNSRDCCLADQSCKTALDYLRSASLRDISIDITPQLSVAKLASGDEGTYEEELQSSLAAAPARAWRNRQGEVVANGQLADFRDGRIVVRQSDGERVRVPFNELSDDDTCFVTAWWSLPTECTMGDEQFVDRNWLATTMTWKASALGHKPLYFEEVQLERYGHSAGPFVQPVVSGAHFFMNVATLPYQMAINPPNECRYALGYYRPGNCAPWLLPPVPLSVRAALAQAGAVVGGIYVIP